MDIAYSIYENEAAAARICEKLVSSEFPPSHVYAFVWRDGDLRRAPVGRSSWLGNGAVVGAALIGAIGAMLTTWWMMHGTVLPPPSMPGVRPPVGAILATVPFGMLGAGVGVLLSALLWRRRRLVFPASGSRPALVAVRVSPGNAPAAKSVLRSGGHTARVITVQSPAADARRLLLQAA